jgi:hypothetical protein
LGSQGPLLAMWSEGDWITCVTHWNVVIAHGACGLIIASNGWENDDLDQSVYDLVYLVDSNSYKVSFGLREAPISHRTPRRNARFLWRDAA